MMETQKNGLRRLQMMQQEMQIHTRKDPGRGEPLREGGCPDLRLWLDCAVWKLETTLPICWSKRNQPKAMVRRVSDPQKSWEKEF